MALEIALTFIEKKSIIVALVSISKLLTLLKKPNENYNSIKYVFDERKNHGIK